MTTAHGEQAPHGQRARRKVGGGQSLSACKQHLPPWGRLTASSHYPLTPAVKSRWGFNCLKGIMVDSRLKRINWRDGEKS
jgi:hypothetical protein